MNMIVPKKLKKGDEVRIVAPARSLKMLSQENIDLAVKKLKLLGLRVTFSKNCLEEDMFMSSSIESRVSDIHDAFKDKKVKAIFTVLGGFNSNQILSYLDYDLIKNNPKILCGYSDVTVLSNAITAKTNLITYSGPHFSTFAMKKYFDYNLEFFKKMLMENEDFLIKPSADWTDDQWFLDQEKRNVFKNNGFEIINHGCCEGKIYGGNLCSFNLLQGTKFMPDIANSILFIEDDDLAGDLFPMEFDRNLQSLIHQENFNKIRGIVIGRFQKKSNMDFDKLRYIIETKKELKNIPIIANVDFGHTNPMITFPIGGGVRIDTRKKEIFIEEMLNIET